VYGTIDKPCFSVSEVCAIIKTVNRRELYRRIPENYRTTLGDVLERTGGGQTPPVQYDRNNQSHTVLLTEAGLYYAVCTSGMTRNCEEFRDWVFETVLPSVRKTGSYTLESVKQSRLETDTLNSKRVELTEKCNDTNDLEGGITVGKCVDDAFAGLYRRGFKQHMGRVISKKLPAVAVASVDTFQCFNKKLEITARVYSIEYKTEMLRLILAEIDASPLWLLINKPE
jgi:prophage antirepressor-like protein